MSEEKAVGRDLLHFWMMRCDDTAETLEGEGPGEGRASRGKGQEGEGPGEGGASRGRGHRRGWDHRSQGTGGHQGVCVCGGGMGGEYRV